MKKSILAGFLLLMVAVAAVADFSVTGQTPTQRMDNTALGLSEISGFNMYCGATVGDYQAGPTFFAGATLPDTTWLVTGLDAGTHYCVFTTVDIDARESVYSEMITLVNEGKALPKPPLIAPNQVITVTTTIQQ